MNLKGTVPMVVYDDRCSLCIRFAQTVHFFSRGRIRLVGHYSKFGGFLKENLLGDEATEMFWYIDDDMAYGGRAGLKPLFLAILSPKKSADFKYRLEEAECKSCDNPKAMLMRLRKLLSNSKKIKLHS